MYQFLITILVLILGVDAFLLSQIPDLEQLVLGMQFADPVYSQGWSTYDADNWSIKYPSSVTPKKRMLAILLPLKASKTAAL